MVAEYPMNVGWGVGDISPLHPLHVPRPSAPPPKAPEGGPFERAKAAVERRGDAAREQADALGLAGVLLCGGGLSMLASLASAGMGAAGAEMAAGSAAVGMLAAGVAATAISAWPAFKKARWGFELGALAAQGSVGEVRRAAESSSASAMDKREMARDVAGAQAREAELSEAVASAMALGPAAALARLSQKRAGRSEGLAGPDAPDHKAEQAAPRAPNA